MGRRGRPDGEARNAAQLMVKGRWSGANAEGGAFEAVNVALTHFERERLRAIELYEIEDLDVRARFEELCAERA